MMREKIAAMANSGFPIAGEGFRADVHVGDRHLRLFSEVYELGHVAMVYDMNEHREVWRQDVDDLETGKQRGCQAASEYLRRLDNALLPEVHWIMNGQLQNRQQQ